MQCPICNAALDMVKLAKELDVQAEKANKRFWQRVWLAFGLGVGFLVWGLWPAEQDVVDRLGMVKPSVLTLTMPPSPLDKQAVPIGGKCKKGSMVVNGGCWVPLRMPPEKGDCAFQSYYALDPLTGEPTCWLPLAKEDRMPVAAPPG